MNGTFPVNISVLNASVSPTFMVSPLWQSHVTSELSPTANWRGWQRYVSQPLNNTTYYKYRSKIPVWSKPTWQSTNEIEICKYGVTLSYLGSLAGVETCVLHGSYSLTLTSAAKTRYYTYFKAKYQIRVNRQYVQ